MSVAMQKPAMPPWLMHGYQQNATNHQCTHHHSMLWLDMGLGKTVITLTSISHLLQQRYLHGVLIVAPIRVCRLVWRQEALKWEHTKHLKFSLLTGSKDQRVRALLAPANIYLINYENVKWLAETLQTYFISKGRPLPFNGIVWDEVSKCKNSTTHRVAAVKKILDQFIWSTGLTGSPASNGYKDLHGQFLVVDRGLRLGTSKTAFRTRFYKKEGFKEIAQPNAEDEIKTLISDITLEMSAADYNPLPDLIVNDVELELPESLRDKYDQMEKEFFLALDSGRVIESFNKASMMNKCLQIAAGAVYPLVGVASLWEPLHDIKLDALEEVIDEAQGQPVLCGYQFRFDAERIMAKFKHLDPVNITECKSERALNDAMRRWKIGDLRLAIGHPGSMSHGIDGLQDAGHIIAWFGLNWSLELYNQLNARLRRQGQGVPVLSHRLIMRDTVDEIQRESLSEKGQTESGLRKAVKEYRQRRGM